MNEVALYGAALQPGTVIKQFAVIECLGFDQNACLYRAENTDTEQSVLLLEYLPAGLVQRTGEGVIPLPGKSAAHKRAMSAYATRLRETALVGHPAVPSFDDIWQEMGTLYAVGPWLSGRTLVDSRGTQATTPSVDTLCQWTRALCDALSALHSHQLIHGNLSPNLLRLRPSGEIILPLVGSETFGSECPVWLAPEQHPLNPKPEAVGPWTDVYQLSALLAQLMTGYPTPSVARRWEGLSLEYLADGTAHVPPGLVVATRKGLSMHPGSRPQTVQAWLQMAGLPDRRLNLRYAPEDAQPEPKQQSRAVGSTGSRSAAATAMERTSHAKREQTFGALSDPFEGSPAYSENTPTWVWLCLGVALSLLVTIVLKSG